MGLPIYYSAKTLMRKKAPHKGFFLLSFFLLYTLFNDLPMRYNNILHIYETREDSVGNDTTPTENSYYRRAKKREIALFSLNNAATNLYMFAFGFLTYYSTGIIGLATLSVANLLGAVKLFDGLIDPLIGVIIDQVNTKKWGRFRPIMFFGNLSLILSFLILFNTHRFTGVWVYVIYVVALFFHKIGYSFQQTVTKAAQPVLTNDPKQRPLFSVYDTLFSSIGIISLGQVFVSNFLVPKHHNEFSMSFFAEFITIVCVLSFLLTILAMVGIAKKDCTEYFGLGKNTVETRTLKDYWSVLKGNRPLQTLAFASTSMKFIAQLVGDQTFLVIIFAILLNNYGLTGQIALAEILPKLIFIALLTRLATRRDLKTAYTTTSIMALFAVLGCTAILLFTDDPTQLFTTGGLGAILFAICFIALRISTNYGTSVILTMSADVSDYETARSGRFVSGLIGTLFSFGESIATALVPIVIGWVVAAAGFGQQYPDFNTPYTPMIARAGLVLLFAVPALLLLIILISIRKYPLNRQQMSNIQSQIEQQKEISTEALQKTS